jgi:hypothetical protein
MAKHPGTERQKSRRGAGSVSRLPASLLDATALHNNRAGASAGGSAGIDRHNVVYRFIVRSFPASPVHRMASPRGEVGRWGRP